MEESASPLHQPERAEPDLPGIEEHASRVANTRRSRRMAQAFGLAFLVLVLLLILTWVRWL